MLTAPRGGVLDPTANKRFGGGFAPERTNKLESDLKTVAPRVLEQACIKTDARAGERCFFAAIADYFTPLAGMKRRGASFKHTKTYCKNSLSTFL
jgi:hypothetical protein